MISKTRSDRIGEDFETASRFQRVLLQAEVLVLGRNPRIADECHTPIVPKLMKKCNIEMMIYRWNL